MITLPKGGPLGFSNIHSVAKILNNEGGPFGGKNFSKKSRTMPKNLEGDPLASPVCMLRGKKKKKTFWFSSQGQMVQFNTIKFCRTCRTILVTSGVSGHAIIKG